MRGGIVSTQLEHVPEQVVASPATLDALAGLPLALNATLELRAVLNLLIEASLAVSHADRCSIFLLRDGRWLEPTAAVGPRPNDDLWEKCRSLPPLGVPAAAVARTTLPVAPAVAL